MVASDSDGAAPKHFLTPEQQVAHLRARGVRFELCPEADATDYLRRGNNYLRTASYRKLYDRVLEGPRAGEYSNLDFAYLVDLSSIDRRLREAFRDLTIDVEHFARLRLLNRAGEEGEDGYAVVADYLASLPSDDRRRVLSGLRRRGSEGDLHDTYSGDLIAHYADSYPMWVFLEVVEFGRFCDLYLFCAGRWGDRAMRQEHYVLKSVKALRNACSHNSCIANGFCAAGGEAEYPPNGIIGQALAAAGYRNGRGRRSKLRNLRLSQMTSALWALRELCGRESTRRRHAERLAALRAFVESRSRCYRGNDALASYFAFLWRVVDIFAPIRA